jgi:hypothetical protein
MLDFYFWQIITSDTFNYDLPTVLESEFAKPNVQLSTENHCIFSSQYSIFPSQHIFSWQ